MPLYEYQCDDCGRRLERIQKFSDPPLTECPSCGGSLRKLLSSPAIQFKGSGWYITDYSRKGKEERGTKDTRDTKDTKDTKESTGTTASEPASDKRPATTAPSKGGKD